MTKPLYKLTATQLKLLAKLANADHNLVNMLSKRHDFTRVSANRLVALQLAVYLDPEKSILMITSRGKVTYADYYPTSKTAKTLKSAMKLHLDMLNDG